MRCEWCRSDADSFGSRISLSVAGRELLHFCHEGCLVHWLYSREPEYFDELR